MISDCNLSKLRCHLNERFFQYQTSDPACIVRLYVSGFYPSLPLGQLFCSVCPASLSPLLPALIVSTISLMLLTYSSII